MNNEYNEAISETLEVLQYLEEDLLNKIPLDVIRSLKKQSSKTYIYKFAETKKVDPNKLSDKAKAVFAVLYRKYIANEEEKIEFDKMLYENETKENSEVVIKPLFEKQEKITEEVLPVIYKKSFIQKIIDKIFKKRK